MDSYLSGSKIAGWLFGGFLFLIGLLNLFLVHPVPALGYFLLGFIYLPPAGQIVKTSFGFVIPTVIKILLGIIVLLFTFGVSDLGDMIDKL